MSAATLSAFVAAPASAQLEIVHDSRETSPLVGVRTAVPTAYVRRAGEWTQYWLYFTYNSQDRGIFRTGRHEGDWEMVQTRGREAVLSQHSGAERCAVGGGVLRVYAAHASHALYFRPGVRDRTFPDPNDEADGRGLRVRPRLVPVSAGSPSWMRYSGRWGSSDAGWVPGEQASPRGPAFQPQGRWSDPAGWARRARACTQARCDEVGECDALEEASLTGAFALLAGAVLLRRRLRGQRRAAA